MEPAFNRQISYKDGACTTAMALGETMSRFRFTRAMVCHLQTMNEVWWQVQAETGWLLPDLRIYAPGLVVCC